MGPLEKFLAKWIAKNPELEPGLKKLIDLEKQRLVNWQQHKAIRDLGGEQGSKGWEDMAWITKPDFNKRADHVDKQIVDLRGTMNSSGSKTWREAGVSNSAPWDPDLDQALADYQEGFYDKVKPRKWWED